MGLTRISDEFSPAVVRLYLIILLTSITKALLNEPFKLNHLSVSSYFSPSVEPSLYLSKKYASLIIEFTSSYLLSVSRSMDGFDLFLTS